MFNIENKNNHFKIFIINSDNKFLKIFFIANILIHLLYLIKIIKKIKVFNTRYKCELFNI